MWKGAFIVRGPSCPPTVLVIRVPQLQTTCLFECWWYKAWMYKYNSLTLAQMFLLSKQFTQWDETLRKLEAPKQVQLTD